MNSNSHIISYRRYRLWSTDLQQTHKSCRQGPMYWPSTTPVCSLHTGRLWTVEGQYNSLYIWFTEWTWTVLSHVTMRVYSVYRRLHWRRETLTGLHNKILIDFYVRVQFAHNVRTYNITKCTQLNISFSAMTNDYTLSFTNSWFEFLIISNI